MLLFEEQSGDFKTWTHIFVFCLVLLVTTSLHVPSIRSWDTTFAGHLCVRLYRKVSNEPSFFINM